MDKLKPCPFCGGEAEYRELRNNNGVSEGFVRCKNLCCEQVFSDFKPTVIEEWNRRAEDGPKA